MQINWQRTGTIEIEKTGSRSGLSFFVRFVKITEEFILIPRKIRIIRQRPAFGMGIAFIV
jgi:hypothetical protein